MAYEQMSFINEGATFKAFPERHDSAFLREHVLSRSTTEDLTPAQVLSMMLSFNHRDDAKNTETAGRLLDRFGSLMGVLMARPEMLAGVEGMSRKDVALIGAMYPMHRRIHAEEMTVPDRISNTREAESYCLSKLDGFRTERFYVIALNAKCLVLGARCISEGSLSEVSAYPRMVMETAISYNAHSVLLTHNHPGGTCAPSPEDIASTIQLQRLLNGVGILVLDHIIVAQGRTYSMIQHGDIGYRQKR